MRDFEIFKYLIFMHLIFANWALRSTPALPQKILPLFHLITIKERHKIFSSGNTSRLLAQSGPTLRGREVSRSKYLADVLHRV